MMTRKDYVAIAAALKDARRPFDGDFGDGFAEGVDNAAVELAKVLAKDNPRFDRARFLNACAGA